MQETLLSGVTHIFTSSPQINIPVQIINNHSAFLTSSVIIVKGIFINASSNNISTPLISVIKIKAYFPISHPRVDQEFRQVIG